MPEYAGIHLLDNPYFLDNAFDYFIPPELSGRISLGDFVMVPFGNANRKRMGLVVSLKEQPDNKEVGCKPILSVCDHGVSLNEEMSSLCFFMKEQTLCTVGDAVRAMIPSSALSYLEEIYRPVKDAMPSLESSHEFDEATLLVFDLIQRHGGVRFDLLKSRFGDKTESAVRRLLAEGLITRDFELKKTTEKTEWLCALAIDPVRADAIVKGSDPQIKLRSAAHLTVLRTLLDAPYDEVFRETELCERCGVNAAQLAAMEKKGLLRREKRIIDRSILREDPPSPAPIELNGEQSAAYRTLCDLSDTGEPRAALLFGVTGSGKTSVMLKTIEHVLAKGKSAIVLLPEIALTPQTLDIFCNRFGKRVAVIHSGLSAGERLDTYMRIRTGGADVVIGTRSAVFAPLDNLGLIIMDEEQEHTYKSDMNPKYHTRDIARFRCAHQKALMLLASATPSFESYYKAKTGVYTLITLKNRYGGATLPKVTVDDVRKESARGASSPLGSLLCERLVRTQKEQNQSILFLNRRGYNNFVSCRSCGEAILCPHCSVSMTYHTKKEYEEGELRCHWCGTRSPLPKTCPSCGSVHLARMGFGTQRVEEELSTLLPDAKILRMDTDTTVSRYSYEEMLGTFRRHEADVLLGTQMVTKGHDFPSVTLVGVLLADASLYLDDYRAAERTFAMLTQVIGRAGRGDRPGEAIIQTANPNHECIRLACEQNYEAFFENEIRLRRALTFPPFCDIASLLLTSHDEAELAKASAILSGMLQKARAEAYSDLPLVIFGPFEASVYKVENKYRMRMIVKCKLSKRTRAMFSEILCEFSRASVRGLSLSIDFNPSNL